MAIYDWNGSANSEIGVLYDWDGSANNQIKEVYDYDGSANHLIYNSELALSNSSQLSVNASGNPGYMEKWVYSTVYWNCSGYNTLTFNLTYNFTFRVESSAKGRIFVVFGDGSTIDLINVSYDVGQTTVAESVDMSSKTDSQKAQVYIGMQCGGACSDWTNKYYLGNAIAQNVVAK